MDISHGQIHILLVKIMKIYDQHLHTYLSYDSKAIWEDYLHLALANEITTFVATDHMDLSCCLMGSDMLPDFSRQKELIAYLSKKYPIDILRGIEVGYKKSVIEQNSKITQRYDFDVVIMSVHENEKADVSTDEFLEGINAQKAYAMYLDLYIEMLELCDDFDIVGHVDYLLRYIEDVDIEEYEDRFRKIFSLIISKEKCLEFNTRFIYQHNRTDYLRYIFTLYYKVGGRSISIGSDAHIVDRYMSGFKEAKEILADIGFKYITAFKKRSAYRINI